METPRNYLAATAFAQSATSYLESVSENEELRAELGEVYEANRVWWDVVRVRKEDQERAI